MAHFPHLVVKLVIEEVFPQSFRKVEDSCDDDTKRSTKKEEEMGRVIVLPWRKIINMNDLHAIQMAHL